VEEFDSQDRALVWRCMGGKHRRLMGDADLLVPDRLLAFREALVALLALPPRALDLASLREAQAALRRRLERFGDCADPREAWARMGVEQPARIPDLEADAFNAMAERLS
jgi:malonate decarboxylase beta subunit